MQSLVRRALVPLALAVAVALAHAQAAHSVVLQDLTWTELRSEIQAGKTTVIIPIGGTEQSGPYLALGKHNARVKVLSQRIAEALGNALVAPVIAYVPEGSYAPPTSHMRFPGTITVPPDVFEKTLESAANSFKVHGFRNIVFLGDHGGYQADLRRVVARLNKSWAGGAARAWVPPEYYEASSTGFDAILRRHGYRDNEIGTHAALADTALELAVAPQMVREQALKSAPAPGPADGVYGGDPRRATAALGQLGVDAIVTKTVAAIRRDTAGRH
ncbi:MAG: Creatinine amidohydrolase [Burkholderiaceae bacterium]|jgi:creatinine amidohydrolase/Fe(II)-dependent formamide hydrolase-like protein|nr:MAG: Creatinine amidohydrolase [Burkholderiaceae bacterium]